MSFSQEPIPAVKSEWTVQAHGEDTPFRKWDVVQEYIAGLLNRNGYEKLVQFNTTVELVRKNSKTKEWTVVLRRPIPETDLDYWWEEKFDAVVIASGHYEVPYIPHHDGLKEFEAAYPGTVEHSKSWRGPNKYAGKNVVVVGASISGPDIAVSLAPVVAPRLHAIVRGNYHPYFGDWAFQVYLYVYLM